jgi:hypothetical protein
MSDPQIAQIFADFDALNLRKSAPSVDISLLRIFVSLRPPRLGGE